MQGKSHLTYTKNAMQCGRHTHWHWTSNSVSMPTDTATAMPSDVPHITLCGNPKEAARMLKLHVGKPSFPYAEVLVGDGVLGQASPREWREQRACLRPAFRSAAVSALVPLMHTHTERMLVDPLLRACGGCIDIHAELHRASFSLIASVALGTESPWIAEHGDALRAAFKAGLQPLYRNTAAGAQAEHLMRRFAEHAWSLAAERSAAGAPLTVVDRLSQNDALSETQRRDELMTVMFAGHETTANTLAWCMYELSRQPDAQARVRADVRAAMRQCGASCVSDMAFADLGKATLLTAAIRETMRLWPVVANGPFRVVGEGGALLTDPEGGMHKVPEGTQFQVPHWTFHRDPTIWGSNADVFDVDRYASGWSHDAFMPFSRPPRDCIGRHFAMASMRVVLAHLLTRFEFAPVEADAPKQGDNWATLQPEGGVRLTVRKSDGGEGVPSRL